MRSDVLVLLQARMGSTRLPGKVLAPIGGVPMLACCLQRLLASGAGRLLVATSLRREDDAVVEEAARAGVAAVRGSERDVLNRFAQGARLTTARFVIRATADNPAVDIDAPRRALDALERSGADYCCERGLPCGAAVEAMRAGALLAADRLATSRDDREHVTPYIRRAGPRFRIVEPEAPVALRRPDVRLTVDTAADLAFLREIAYALPVPLSTAPLTTVIAAADRLAAGARVA